MTNNSHYLVPKLSASVLVVTVMLSACSTVSPVKQTRMASKPVVASKAVKPQKRAIASARKPVNSQWWQRFGDSQMVSLIQQALGANPDITTAKANLQSAQSQLAITTSNFGPSGSVSGSSSNSTSRTSFSSSANASWEIDVYGRKRITRQAAEADLNSVYATLDDVKVSIAAEVAKAYVNLRWNQASLGLYKQSFAKRTENLKLVQLKRDAGISSGLEYDQARLSVGEIKAELPALEKNIEQSQYALAVLLGKNPNQLSQQLQRVRPIPAASVNLANNIRADAIRQRPDLRAAEYQVKAAKLRVRQAQLDKYPSFSIGGNIGLSGLNLGDLLDPGNIARSIAASISAPLFNRGKLDEQVKIKESTLIKAQSSYRKTVVSALEDVANVLSELQAQKKQKPQLISNNHLTRSNFNLARKNYEVGLSDFQSVLDSDQKVLNSNKTLLSAQAQTSLSLINLYKAIGGEW